MTPGARLQATIELYDIVVAAMPRPADAVVAEYFRARRFIGSSDRRDIAERLYRWIRRRAQLRWWLERVGAPADAGRSLCLAELVLVDRCTLEILDELFDDGRFKPASLEPAERRWVGKLLGHTLHHPDQSRAVIGNIPGWIESELFRSIGQDIERELAGLLEHAPVDLRVNTLKGTRVQAQKALTRERIGTDPTKLSPHGLRVHGRPSLVAGDAFRSGLVEIQDEGSQLVASLVDAKPGSRIVDYCAGAGGKTLALAGAMQNKGIIVACDVSGPRLERAVKRLRRAGAHNVERRVLDGAARKWIKRAAASFDRVLVDAPCSGTGTWRRNPDGRWSLKEQDVAELIVKQSAILEDAARLVKPGGRLVYATCSLLASENAEQVEAFLARHANFTAMPVANVWREVLGVEPPAGAVRGPYLQLTPARHGTDGFFVAILERKNEPVDPAKKKAQKRNKKRDKKPGQKTPAPEAATGDPA